MSIYRPAGYGPAPTVEEHRAAPWAPDYDIHITDWLHRRSAGGAVQVRTLCEYGGRLLYNGASSDLSGEWCLLDIATGLPCAIGTPPETERERMERALREAAGAMVRRAVTVALDVDGTLVTNAYPELGEDLGATPWLRRVAARFPVVRFMLWTLRGGSTADEARQWLEERGVTVWAVNRHPEAESWHGSPKAHADLYVDDRALGAPLRADGCVDWDVAGPALMAAVERLVRR